MRSGQYKENSKKQRERHEATAQDRMKANEQRRKKRKGINDSKIRSIAY
jgi:hypothetical protein